MPELIVALDGPKPYELFSELVGACRWFKLDPLNIMDEGFWRTAWLITHKLFLDLKLVSPSFSVRETVNRYIDAGVAAVSTYTYGDL